MLRWLRDAWVIAGITLLLVLVVDAVLNNGFGPEPWPAVDPDAVAPDRADAEFFQTDPKLMQYWQEHGAARAMRWTPYVYWRRQPHAGEQINVDDEGIRRSWTSAEREPGWTLWVAGGSSVWGTGVDDDSTVPSWIARLLAEAGEPAQVINLGESGYVTGQSLAFVQERLRHAESPDLVLFLEGANDVFAALQAGRAGVPQNEGNRTLDFRTTDGVEKWIMAFPRALEGIRGFVAPVVDPDSLDLDALAADVVSVYLENRRQARAVLAVHGSDTLHAWQPTIFGRFEPSAFEQQVLGASLQHHRDLQQRADARISVSPADDHQLVLTNVFDRVRETVFMDPLHLGPGGNRTIAAAVVPSLLEWRALQVGDGSLAEPATE
ncbi:MAG: GDSL-type esterase/lipase family protein [Pseudomonadota bacterium]